MNYVKFVNWDIIYKKLLVSDYNLVARHADHPLQKILSGCLRFVWIQTRRW